ncbi:hypothetical protein PI172_0341 [Prevotella intermedia]|uniref:Uncharacterized protein n=1 Tax=Prevotella intermedia TaxID=28131 RepID=A0AAD1BG82_PREIN|nr:hypothetical protein PIN17_A0419 [Prevotella intermedia 17]BAR95069.1 hypothetical protein PI172_0341 [Prevotella intermedia]
MEDKVQGLHGNGSSPPSSLFDASFAFMRFVALTSFFDLLTQARL